MRPMLNARELCEVLGISRSTYRKRLLQGVYTCLLHPNGRGQRQYCARRVADFVEGKPIARLRRAS